LNEEYSWAKKLTVMEEITKHTAKTVPCQTTVEHCARIE
jgi:hypothetical protein